MTEREVPRDSGVFSEASLRPSMAISSSINCQNILMANSSSVIKKPQPVVNRYISFSEKKINGSGKRITAILAILRNLK